MGGESVNNIQPGFYLGIYVWVEAQMRGKTSGVWGFPPENFEFQIAKDATLGGEA